MTVVKGLNYSYNIRGNSVQGDVGEILGLRKCDMKNKNFLKERKQLTVAR